MLIKKLIVATMFVSIFAVASVQAAGDVAKGKKLAEEDCEDCHGDDGLGDEDNPPIAGMDPKEHIQELMDYKSGKRVDENEDMEAEDLSEQDMADVAAYYATLPGPPPKK